MGKLWAKRLFFHATSASIPSIHRHDYRNLAEYEGWMEIDEQLLRDLIAATHALSDLIDKLK